LPPDVKPVIGYFAAGELMIGTMRFGSLGDRSTEKRAPKAALALPSPFMHHN